MKPINRFIILFPLFLSPVLVSAATYYTRATGNWNAASTWSTAGCGGAAAATTPGSAAGDIVIICNGHTVSVTANPSNSIASVTVQSGGYLLCGTTGGGANRQITITAGGTFTVNNGGTYEHNTTTAASTSVFQGTESFGASSTVIISKWSSNATTLISSVASNFGHLTLKNSTGGSLWDNEGLGSTRTIQGNFTVQSSCLTVLNRAAGNITVTVGGNFTLATSGLVYGKYSCSGNFTMNVAGSTSVSGASSVFYGIFAGTADATGNFIYSTASYTQTAGNFWGSTYGGFPFAYNAGGSVTFTCTGAYTQSGGTHYGNDFGFSGNYGNSTYSIGSMSFTGGTFVAYSTEINDGRTNTLSITNDCNIAFASTGDFFLLSNVFDAAQNQNQVFTVGGNLTISGAAAFFVVTVESTGNSTITVGGNLSVSGGDNYFPYSTTSPTVISVNGNVTFTGGTTTCSSLASSRFDLTLGTASVNWNQTVTTVSLCNTNVKSGKTVTLTGTRMGEIQTSRTTTVESGAKLYCSNFPVTGTGGFTLASGGWIGSGSAAGLTASGATGNVQVTGTRNYDSGATYEFYEAITPQSTGNFTTTTTSGTYPAQVANLIINKTLATNVVNLTSTTDVNNVLTLTSGVLTTSSTAATSPWVRIPTDAASVSPVGGSASSYVDGYIRKTGSAAFIYPTGNGGKWRRIEQSAPSASTEFEARYVASAYTNTTNMAAAPATVLDHVSTVEHWFLSKPLGATGSTTFVKLYWENAGASGISKFDSLTVARWSGTGWENTNCYGSCPANWTSSTAQRTYTGSATGSGAGTIQSNTVSSFSPFTFGSIGIFNANPLPIELLNFEAILNDNQVDLNWSTASEKNNDYFTIERSKDGQVFETILTVDGPINGNSTSLRNYFEVDYSPYSGVSYYRLKQTDFDGKTSYSNIVPVENNTGTTNLTIFPNPTTQGTETFVSISSTENTEILVVLRDATGRELFSKVIVMSKTPEVIAINKEGQLAKGVYLITASSKNQFYSKKLIIK